LLKADIILRTDQDYKYMQLAYNLAQKGCGGVNPNPLVGALIVKDDRIIGEGYHEIFGGPHAEVNAFRSAKESVEGATMYVTLEPCSHYGKTPPCAQAIVDNKIARVVIGMLDPNPLVSGRGVKLLEEHGIEVESDFLSAELAQMNRVFLKFIQSKKPFVIMKTAMTLDGKIASRTGDSRWVSNEQSRANVHELRNELMGIMVGVDTVIADNPILTTRLTGNKKGRNPIRIVVDSQARIPLDSKMLNTTNEAKTIVAVTSAANQNKVDQINSSGNEVLVVAEKDGRVDLNQLMQLLGEKGIGGILLEGGATLNYAALESQIIDEVHAYIAPKIIGGNDAKTPVGGDGIEMMKDAVNLQNIRFENIADDILVIGEVVY